MVPYPHRRGSDLGEGGLSWIAVPMIVGAGYGMFSSSTSQTYRAVSVAGTAGFVAACAAEEGRFFLIVEVLAYIRRLSGHSDVWRRTGSVAVWPAQLVQAAVAWYHEGTDLVVLRMA